MITTHPQIDGPTITGAAAQAAAAAQVEADRDGVYFVVLESDSGAATVVSFGPALAAAVTYAGEISTARYLVRPTAERDAAEALIAQWAGSAGEHCVTCGKRTGSRHRAAWHVQITIDARPLDTLAGDLDDRDGSQGWWPVGSGCAKRWPAGYLEQLPALVR